MLESHTTLTMGVRKYIFPCLRNSEVRHLAKLLGNYAISYYPSLPNISLVQKKKVTVQI